MLTKPLAGVMVNPIHPLSRGCVGHWLFNEGAGHLAFDISRYGNHGVLKNMPPNIQGSGWAGSKFGGGLDFDGINDYVNCGSDASLDITDAITIAAWAKQRSKKEYARIVFKGDGGGTWAYGLSYDGSGEYIRMMTYTSSYKISTSPTASIYNQWYHFVGIYNGSVQKLYIDGIEVASDAQSGDLQSAGLLGIGAELVISPERFFDGGLDDVRVYNRALGEEEIKQLYYDPFCNLLQVSIWQRYVSVPAILARSYGYIF